MIDVQGIDVLMWDYLWSKWVPRCWSRYTWTLFVLKDNNFWILEKKIWSIQVDKVQCTTFVIFSKIGKFEIGQNVKVGINLRGREWENPQTKEIKYFNSIQGWRIELLENSNSGDDLPPLDNLSPFEPASETNDEDLDDLPF